MFMVDLPNKRLHYISLIISRRQEKINIFQKKAEEKNLFFQRVQTQVKKRIKLCKQHKKAAQNLPY